MGISIKNWLRTYTFIDGQALSMSQTDQNRFQIFFKDEKYLILKNHLYNYFLHKRAVRKCLQQDDLEIVLEVGSGISPILTGFNPTIFSDLSYDALKTLKGNMGRMGYYVVANAGYLPFKSSVFSHAICSEVLEHMQDDVPAIKELSRTLKKPSGSLIITVPHRNCYFTNDDRFVNHYRRYELREIEGRLKSSGLRPVYMQKCLAHWRK